MSGPFQVEVTDDGSPTLYSSQFDAHYHSKHGALNESRHVFIKEGLEHFCNKSSCHNVSVLEYGFGTGLNALLTELYSLAHLKTIRYHSLEAYPIPAETYQDLSFIDTNYDNSLRQLHKLPWGIEHQVSDHFYLFKEKVMFENFSSEKKFDIIFFDAFAPSTQPHLWEEQILSVATDALSMNGILVTFCAKGAFKRCLKSLGLEIERIPGPPGKREMTRATKVG